MDEDRIRRMAQEILGRAYRPAVLYRFQFNKDFPLTTAVEYCGWLRDMGVDTVYASPLLTAAPGSVHGYNVVDPTRINPELGGEEGFAALSRRLKELGLGLLLDIVPNHMGIGHWNALWMDVLEHGRHSRYAGFFDIDWEPTKEVLHGKVLLPILGGQFGRILEEGSIRLEYARGRFLIRYYEHVLPLCPESVPLILEQGLELLATTMRDDPEEYRRFLSVLTAFRNLPCGDALEETGVEERYREAWSAQERLDRSCTVAAAVREHVERAVGLCNGRAGEPHSFDLLQELLDRQYYRLASWHVAGEEINYRRFFDINDLAAIRMEDPRVFEYCHGLLFRLLSEGRVQGLRIDHSDGLYDPQGYFRMLQLSYLVQVLEERIRGVKGTMEEKDTLLLRGELSRAVLRGQLPLYVVIEKILDRKENLPEDWLVHGTVGYDFLNLLNRLFIRRENEKEFDGIYTTFIGGAPDMENLLSAKKRLFAKNNMPGEINVLAHRLSRITERRRRYRDFTLNNLRNAIRELITFFPVYRTYIGPEDREVSERDAKYIHIATEKARSHNPYFDPSLFDFIRDVLLLRFDEDLDPDSRALYQDFILRFQQITSPIMAKGVEDTAFYIGNRFISLNEVGGDPDHFGCSAAEFHRENSDRRRNWPLALIATSTHDTKRSEDIRQRLNVLSEIPEEWRRYLKRFTRITGKYRVPGPSGLLPDRNTEYFIYQTLLGVWPDYPVTAEQQPRFVERMWTHIRKAVREAKTHTSWLRPDEAYEAAVAQFLRAILRSGNYFLKVFRQLQARVSAFAKYNTLAAINLRMGAPGVLDNYQGSELWNYSLVDPDNRRPVDFNLRRHLLGRVQSLVGGNDDPAAVAVELLREKRDSRIKIFTLWRGQNFRSRYRELFLDGEYLPLEVEGGRAEHVTAYARVLEERIAIVVSGRFFWTLCGGMDRPPTGGIWEDTRVLLPAELAGRAVRDIYTGLAVLSTSEEGRTFFKVAELFRYYPFAFLSNLPWEAWQGGADDAAARV